VSTVYETPLPQQGVIRRIRRNEVPGKMGTLAIGQEWPDHSVGIGLLIAVLVRVMFSWGVLLFVDPAPDAEGQQKGGCPLLNRLPE